MKIDITFNFKFFLRGIFDILFYIVVDMMKDLILMSLNLIFWPLVIVMQGIVRCRIFSAINHLSIIAPVRNHCGDQILPNARS